VKILLYLETRNLPRSRNRGAQSNIQLLLHHQTYCHKQKINDYNWVLLWSLKMLNFKLVISVSKNSFLALKTIIFLIDLRIRNLKQNVKMSDQSNVQISSFSPKRTTNITTSKCVGGRKSTIIWLSITLY